MNDPDLRVCPVCEGERRRLLYRQRFTAGPMGSGYDVVVCMNCGAGFADRIPSQAFMDRYYAEQSKYTYEHAKGVESPWDIRRFEKTADLIIPYLNSPDAKILDIGCATGGLLSVLKTRGYRNIMGVDPSPECSIAANRLYNVTVRTATLAQLVSWSDRFDLILMVGVLEHLREVKDAISAASQLLKNRGKIYCAVPDVQGLSTCHNAPYQQFSVEHVNFFSTISLGRVMSECGMVETRSWNWRIEWREGVWEPIASGLYARGHDTHKAFDSETESALERYLDFSKNGDLEIIATIDAFITSNEPLIVWGTGTLTRRLLANTRLNSANIVAFVDSNVNSQGNKLCQRPILSPQQLKGRNETILVCSLSFAAEIAGEARHQHGLRNRLVSILGVEMN